MHERWPAWNIVNIWMQSARNSLLLNFFFLCGSGKSFPYVYSHFCNCRASVNDSRWCFDAKSRTGPCSIDRWRHDMPFANAVLVCPVWIVGMVCELYAFDRAFFSCYAKLYVQSAVGSRNGLVSMHKTWTKRPFPYVFMDFSYSFFGIKKNWRKTQRFQKTFGNRLLCAASMNVENVLGVRKKGFSPTPSTSISFRTPSTSTVTAAAQLPRVSLECIIKIIIIGRLFYWYLYEFAAQSKASTCRPSGLLLALPSTPSSFDSVALHCLWLKCVSLTPFILHYVFCAAKRFRCGVCNVRMCVWPHRRMYTKTRSCGSARFNRFGFLFTKQHAAYFKPFQG